VQELSWKVVNMRSEERPRAHRTQTTTDRPFATRGGNSLSLSRPRVLVLVLAVAHCGVLAARVPLHDLPPRLGAVVRGGLRLRGGASTDGTLVEDRRRKKGLTVMDTTNKIRASKVSSAGEVAVPSTCLKMQARV